MPLPATGITCRYALTHTATDDQHVLLRNTLQQAKQQQQTEEGAQGNGAAAVADGGANGAAAGDGVAAAPPSDIPTSVAPLPHLGPIEKESNVLPKDVQAKLWKNRYGVGWGCMGAPPGSRLGRYVADRANVDLLIGNAAG